MHGFESSELARPLLNMDLEADQLPKSKMRIGDKQLREVWKRSSTLGRKGVRPLPASIGAIFILTVLCIFQGVWIHKIFAGLRPYSNSPFDRLFPKTITRTSPSIWDDDRQSFIHNTRAVRIHSHNDNEQRLPLFEALGSGCISIEADVHLVDENLLVGHSSKDLHPYNTLADMYIQPLLRMIDDQNKHVENGSLRGMYTRDPDKSLVLLIDHKTDGAMAFDALYDQLQSLRDRDYLTYWNGTDRIMRPLTIVASGKAPFESVLALNASHRDIFWDADLRNLSSTEDDFTVEPPLYKYNISNSYYASARWADVTLWFYPESRQWPSPQAKDIAGPQKEQAESRGLLTRYWETPAGPPSRRDLIWRILQGLDVYVINMDDMVVVRDRSVSWGHWELSA